MYDEIEFEIEEETPIEFDLEDDVYLVEPKVEKLEVIPSKEQQEFKPVQGTYYNDVVVDKIPDEYVIPKLNKKTITKNGTYNAVDDNLDGYSEVEVSTSGVDINEYFTDTIGSGDSNVGGWVKTIKKLPSPFPISGISCSYMFNRYQGTTLPQIDTSNITSMQGMFYGCNNLVNLDLSSFNTNKVTDMSGMFQGCSSLTSLDLSSFNTSNVTSMNGMFSSCKKLKELSVNNFDTSKVTNIQSMFQSCSSLTSLDLSNFDVSLIQSFSSLFSNCYNLQTIVGGLLNAGKSYLTTINANYYYYRIDLSSCSLLLEQSLINVLNSLYDIATKGCNTQQVVLGSTNLAKLTSEAGQQALTNAQNRGWSIS